MSGPLVVILGGTGFVGRALTRELDRRGVAFRTVSRHASVPAAGGSAPPRAHETADITRRRSLELAVGGADVVVNLVAASPLLPAGTLGTYLGRHLRGVRNLLDVCAEAVPSPRLVHVGALGVRPESDAPYAWTKACAERMVAESPLDAVVLSPSILFGDGSELIATLDLAARLPVVPLPEIRTPFQPLAVDDLAAIIADAALAPLRLAAGGAVARHYEVVGPDTMRGAEFARLYLHARGCRTIPVPASAVHPAIEIASALRLPGFPFQLAEMLRMSNVETGDLPVLRTAGSYEEWIRQRVGWPP